VIETGLHLDMTKFDAEFRRITKDTVPALTRKGMFRAMNELLNDAVRLSPQAPKDVGNLWASKADTVSIKQEGDTWIIEGGFNIAYAAKWHEISPSEAAKINWTRTKGAREPGPKFLEMKMNIYREKYMKIVAATIEGGAR